MRKQGGGGFNRPQFYQMTYVRFDRKLNGMTFRSNHKSTISWLAYASCRVLVRAPGDLRLACQLTASVRSDTYAVNFRLEPHKSGLMVIYLPLPLRCNLVSRCTCFAHRRPLSSSKLWRNCPLLHGGASLVEPSLLPKALKTLCSQDFKVHFVSDINFPFV